MQRDPVQRPSAGHCAKRYEPFRPKKATARCRFNNSVGPSERVRDNHGRLAGQSVRERTLGYLARGSNMSARLPVDEPDSTQLGEFSATRRQVPMLWIHLGSGIVQTVFGRYPL